MKVDFIRHVRTSSSEVYGILENDIMIGRLDLHFSNDGRIDGLVIFSKQLSKEDELKLCQKIDIEIVDEAELDDNNFCITFATVSNINVFGKDNK